jgi:hypothetical protein
MNKNEPVIYIDAKGSEHLALVTAVNPFTLGRVSLVYVDVTADERENLVQLSDVAHMDDSSKQENNPDLPTIHLNCWKEYGDRHSAPAVDHPMFDHPFAPKPKDEEGRVVEASRPNYDAQVAAHQEANAVLPSAADLDAAAADQQAAQDTAGN